MSDESASDTAEEHAAASEGDDEEAPAPSERDRDAEATGSDATDSGEGETEPTEAAAEADDGPESDADEGDAETPASDEDTTDDEPEDGIQESDFIKVSFTAYSAESDQLVDTTDPEVAEEEGIDAEQESIEPRIVPIGAGHLFPSVEGDFIGKEVGDTGTVTVPPAEAFGEYDPDSVRTVSADVIPEDDRYPGAVVELEGESGHVERIIGGRARVDFNHPLAGQEIEYEYEILELVEDPIEQAKGMLEPIVDVDLTVWIQTDEVEEEVVVEEDEAEDDADEDVEDDEDDAAPETETQLVEKQTLYIESVPQMAMNQRWLFSKRQLAQDLIDRLDLDRVVIQETIEGAAGPLGGMGGLGGLGQGEEIEDVAAAIEDVDLDEEDAEAVEDLDLDVDVETEDDVEE